MINKNNWSWKIKTPEMHRGIRGQRLLDQDSNLEPSGLRFNSK